MNNELPLKQIIDAALSRIGSVADVNPVVGEPLSVGDGHDHPVFQGVGGFCLRRRGF